MKHSPYFDDESRKFTGEGVRYIADTFKGFYKKNVHESDTAEYLRNVLCKFSDSVSLQDVSYRVGAQAAAYTGPAALMIFSTVVFFISHFSKSPAFPIAALFFGIFALCWFVYGFLFGRPVGNFLLRKGTGKNVYAVRNSSSGTTKRIIICANIDSADEYRYSTGFTPNCLLFFTLLFALGMIISVLFFLIYMAKGLPCTDAAWVKISTFQLCLNIIYIPALFFFSHKRRVRGAAHNLSGAYAAVGIMRELSNSAYRYKDTRVECLLTCAKNSGQRGAGVFIKNNLKQLKGAQTLVVVLESLCKTDEIAVVVRDESGLQKTTDELFSFVSTASGNVGIKIKRAPIRLGSTDAVKFNDARISAVAIRAVGKNSRQYYPNRFDSAKAVNAECIEGVMRLVIEIINLLSENNELL